jgi:prepilin-type N-terminal cleavage/methylation domain-containing protein
MNLLKGTRGFTLVEVLIAMVVLAIALMGLATLQVRCIRSNNLANRTTQATNLAQVALERIIFMQATGTNFPAGGPYFDDENPVSVPADNAGAIFTRSFQFIDDSPVPAARTIIVRVEWEDIMGDHEVEVEAVTTAFGY